MPREKKFSDKARRLVLTVEPEDEDTLRDYMALKRQRTLSEAFKVLAKQLRRWLAKESEEPAAAAPPPPPVDDVPYQLRAFQDHEAGRHPKGVKVGIPPSIQAKADAKLREWQERRDRERTGADLPDATEADLEQYEQDREGWV